MRIQAKGTNVNNYDPALALGFPVPLIDLDTTTATEGMVVTYQLSTDSAIWAAAPSGSGSANTSPVYSLGSADNFAALAGTALTFSATGITIAAGDVGQTTLTGTATYTSGSNTGTAAPYAQAIIDVAAEKVVLLALTGTAITNVAALELNDLSSLGAGVFAPGIYTSAAAIGVTASSTITLSGVGDYVFLAKAGAITFGANVTVVLTNGATAARVFWVASTDLSTTGANSVLVGNFLVRDATIADSATLNGRILASREVTIAGVANTMTIPGGVQAKISIAELESGIAPSHILKFIRLGSTITTTALVGLKVGDIIVSIVADGTSVVALCATADTLPSDPADTTYLFVYRAVS